MGIINKVEGKVCGDIVIGRQKRRSHWWNV